MPSLQGRGAGREARQQNGLTALAMREYRREFKRLKAAEAAASFYFPRFGVNKRQQIVRLLYEISKREGARASDIIKDSGANDFARMKGRLLRRRFPYAYSCGQAIKPYLPKADFGKSWVCDLRDGTFRPREGFVERKASGSFLAKRFKMFFPDARFQEISSLKDYNRKRRQFTPQDYNRRREAVFIANEGYDFFKPCPCTKGALSCGYSIFNLGFGCVFECTYCYLQAYANNAGIILPANIDRFFDGFSAHKRRVTRLGSGEFTDSLALDDITQFSVGISDFFRKRKGPTFEFKTKSAGIENLLKVRAAENIVVSWSLNPQRMIDENEHFTASLKQRLQAAARCARATAWAFILTR